MIILYIKLTQAIDSVLVLKMDLTTTFEGQEFVKTIESPEVKIKQ